VAADELFSSWPPLVWAAEPPNVAGQASVGGRVGRGGGVGCFLLLLPEPLTAPQEGRLVLVDWLVIDWLGMSLHHMLLIILSFVRVA